MKKNPKLSKFNRYFTIAPVGLITLIVTVIVLITAAVVIDLTKGHSAFSTWVFNFVTNWSGVLSAVAALIMAIAAFTAIRGNRRTRASENVRNWAKNTLDILMALPKELPNRKDNASKYASEIIGKICIEALSVGKDAAMLGFQPIFESLGKELIRLDAAIKDESLPIIELMEPYGKVMAYLMIFRIAE